MVDHRVVEAVRATFHNRIYRVLVTGGTGFVGSHVAWLLIEAGHDVTVVGRNPYRLGSARHPRMKFKLCDLSDETAVNEVCDGHDFVIHAAAQSATWGPAQSFYLANVAATQHLVNYCLANKQRRFIHVSSTAIHFEHHDKLNVAEESPLPSQFGCEYAKSKADAEAVVLTGIKHGLDAVIIRARAVFGPGDNHLLPRLLRAAQKGKLPQIGNGRNLVDFTYIDNLAYAISLAMVRGDSGSVCTITNEEPVLLWPTLNRIFEHLKMPVAKRGIPYPLAFGIARIMEVWHRLRQKPSEPRLTTYGVGLLAKSQTFSPDAARRVLQYRPIVSLDDGIQHTLKKLTDRDDQPSKVIVDVELFTTGYTSQPYGLAEQGRGRERQSFHASCALIRHPERGLYLFDTGYAPRFFEATRKFPFNIYGRLSPIVVAESLTIRSQLDAQGIAAREVRGIILSHFHADHVAGLRDFPETDLIASAQAWQAVSRLHGIAALRRGYIPSLMPADAAKRFHTIEHFHDPGMGPFDRTHDLFGDGSVRLIELPGHACGQIGALIQISPTRRVFLVADATWTLGSMRSCRLPHPITYSFIDSISDLRATLVRLNAFAKQYPDIDIIPTHCPEVARRYAWDEVVLRHTENPR